MSIKKSFAFSKSLRCTGWRLRSLVRFLKRNRARWERRGTRQALREGAEVLPVRPTDAWEVA